MFKSGKDDLLKFFREDLPVRGVDLIIEGVKLARDVSSTAARLIARGSIPAPGFVQDMARDKVNEEDDLYKVAEPEHDWDRKIEPPPPPAEKKEVVAKPKTKKTASKKPAKKKPARKKKTVKKTVEKKPAVKKPNKKAKSAPKKKKDFLK